MNALKDWWPLFVVVAGWIVTAAVQWTNTKNKLNGLGGRVRKVEESCSASGGRMDRFERELSEYRRDAADTSKGLARVEKGVEDLGDSINQGNLQIGSQLHSMEKSMQEKDVRTQVRLTRIETVARIEDKLGPIPTENL